MAKRSCGTTTFGVISIIYGFIALWLTVIGAIGLWVLKNDPQFASVNLQISGLDILSSFIAFGCALSFLVSGVGVLCLKEWARKLITWVAIVAIPNGLYGGLSGALKNPTPTGVEVPAIAIIVISLLTIAPFIAGFSLVIWHFKKNSTREQFVTTGSS